MIGKNLALRTFGRIKNRLLAKAVILMYHRVVELESDPWSLCVTPDHFAEHLEVITRLGRPASLSDLVKGLHNGQVQDRTIVVTFDDGYADNFYFAKPALERYDVPGTVFVVAEAVGQQSEFWWDELEQLLLAPDRLPETLNLSLNGLRVEWQLGQESFYTEEDRQDDQDRDPWTAPAGSRLAFFYSVWQQLLLLSPEARTGALSQIAAWSGAEKFSRASHRIMDAEEVVRLQQGGLVEVGGHTATHVSLPSLSRAEQREEIQRGKRLLEDLLGLPVSHFAYPHGEYNSETVALVKETGFQSACTVVTNSIYRGANPFLLPRFDVRDWDGDEFSRRLSEWFRTGKEV
jgi:peptidoglycan/xylan/chitin deacetylase (PgdA/CDA1 family)